MDSHESVEFESEGAILRGRLYLPSGQGPFAGLAMANGFSATLTMCADRYAEVFAAHGLAVLLYDHRNFGSSDGDPRGQINPWLQARGYRSALDWLASDGRIDPRRLGIWGDSFTGGVSLLVAACDARVRAVIAQCPACGRQPPPPDPDGSRFQAMRETLLHGDITPTPETTTGPLPVVSFDQVGTPSLLTPLTAFRWFIEYGGRHNSGWHNLATRALPPVPEPYHPALCAPHVRVPTLALIASDDEMPGATATVSRPAFEAIPGPCEILELPGGHFGLMFHPSPEFDFASTAQASFLVRTL